jgi:hypothetical protein
VLFPLLAGQFFLYRRRQPGRQPAQCLDVRHHLLRPLSVGHVRTHFEQVEGESRCQWYVRQVPAPATSAAARSSTS